MSLFPLLDTMTSLSPYEIQQRFSLKRNPETTENQYGYYTYFDKICLGYVELFHFAYQHRLVWQDFFPLQYASYLNYEHAHKFLDVPDSISFGLGTLGHVEPLKAILKEHEQVRYGTIQSSDEPTPGRVKHLKQMGLSIEETDFRIYLNKSLNYALSKGFDY